ncbi:pilus assembly protein N-terminal domain-containing protein [Pseudomonas lalucatii]|uniref:Pilus assembly protein N-terminal domain-containing protein n=1 Tax=Pseudomonas lalucatii TaxID=1424203 RepID=A0ABS5Q6N4_9PSED|nr:pilus assembly protein N-terminal domain-containing protein [Pseudomonas lalucatii]MBS7663993.1 pilus assembly protein N-terminal domain-containing protein [Pseudomonas lalucatii]
MKSTRSCLLLACAAALIGLLLPTPLQAGLTFVEDASGRRSAGFRDLIQWTHSRLLFDKELKRVAIGQEKTLEVEILGGRELLVLAKNVGRTTLIVWYADGSSETYLFSVSEDLSVLRSALHDIHSGIRLEPAPDRPALVLRGKVPTVKYKVAAEAAARHYLGVRQQGGAGVPAQDPGQNLSSALQMVVAAQDGNRAGGNALRLDAQSLGGDSRVAVINLIQVETLPKSMELKIRDAIAPLGGGDVRIRRVMRGDIADDYVDTLILEGEVRDQVTLTRVLNVASSLFLGDQALADVAVIADESGGLLDQRGSTKAAASLISGLDGGAGIHDNDLRANVGRAKLLSLANGRLLSMIEVRDLPQVRVAVQIHEVNRNRLYSWRPDLSLVTQGYNTEGLFGLGGLGQIQPDSSTVENALQIIGGSLTNNLQIGSSRLAFDLLFSLMEQEGISRTLSRPTLMVLAGESAVFSVGGEVPVPTAFAPTGLKSGDEVGNNTPGVFSGTSFKSFGVQLKVRAMVDENDRITLDVNPTVSAPDTLLTRQISGSTGSNLNSTAFNTRSISTTTRLQDGQPLILGGLVSSEQSTQEDFTPGVNQIPLLGRLAEASSDSGQDRELIIVVTPTLVRETQGDVHLWAFPSPLDLAQRALQPGLALTRQEEH